tara:strand:- start:853 stop:1038 length:186 start_codon:yes stop_codon:yes gene_type:complete
MIEVKKDKSTFETKVTDTLPKAREFASRSSMIGDLVVITEGYEASDGHFDTYDHVASWCVE